MSSRSSARKVKRNQNFYEIPRIPVNRKMTFQQMLEIAEGFHQDKSLQKCEGK